MLPPPPFNPSGRREDRAPHSLPIQVRLDAEELRIPRRYSGRLDGGSLDTRRDTLFPSSWIRAW